MTDDDVPLPSTSLAELDELAARHGWQTHHAWSALAPEQGRVRLTLTRHVDGPQARFVHQRPTVDGPVSNDPRQGALLRVLKHRTRTVLRQSLPDHMVPSRVLTLPAFPLTPNGKTDRLALKEIARQQTPSTDHVPPSGPVQDLLHELWCEALGVSRVSVTENIFDADATSLLVVQVQQDLRLRHGIDLALTAFFAHPTISALAQVLQSDGERPGAGERAASMRTQNATAARRRGRRRAEDGRR